jgi:hypothetical protein
MHKPAVLVGLILWVAAACVCANDATQPTEYLIRQSVPSTGSHVKRPIIRAGSISLEKPWSELAPEEKASLKAQYEHLGDSDEPPFPSNGMMPIFVALKRIHEESGLQYRGQMTAYVSVASDGKPRSVAVLQSPSQEITDVLVTSLMSQTYKPALCKGVPCAMEFPFRGELVGPDVREINSLNPSTGLMTRPPGPLTQ